MNLFESIAVLCAVSASFPLAGGWLSWRLTSASPAERFSTATLVGLAVLIWNVSVLGAFRPIQGAGAFLCLWPLVLTLLGRRARKTLVGDLRIILRGRRGILICGGAAVFLAALLAPLLRPGLVFYDGTSNHDAFFWISGAELLKRHDYLVEPAKSVTQPFLNVTGVLTGWRPLWGRIASEGLLALLSSVVGASPLKLYLCATAALYFPWVAGTYLVAKTFLLPRLTTAGLVGLVLAQPVFVFFHANANLPNLLGVLSAALLVVAFERTREPSTRRSWAVIVALALHALLCSYPELAPFVLLPVGLLWLRLWWRERCDRPEAPALRAVTFALLAGLLINPLTAVRACFGFESSLWAARHIDQWANIFHALGPLDYPAALATMCTSVRADFTGVGAALLSLAAVGAAGLVFRHARDRFGAAVLFSGSFMLLVYTLWTGFDYGWQKTAQFSGLLIAAFLPATALSLRPAGRGGRRRALWACLGGAALLFGYATVRNCLLVYKWSERKDLTSEWFDLRDYARTQLAGRPVLVDAPTFRMPFFHGMWAVYFLADNPPFFTARGRENGGYLRDYTRTEKATPGALLHPVLVSAPWAASFDANSPRLFAGPALALLDRANRVTALQGFSPENGVPEAASTRFSIQLIPHAPSQLAFELAPLREDDFPPFPVPARWSLVVRAGGTVQHAAEITGPPPWRFVAPLRPGVVQSIEVAAGGPPAPAQRFPFAVRTLRIESLPSR